MIVSIFDLNGFSEAADPDLVRELMGVAEETPLHVKASDQEGKQGSLIFDPVGTNEFIKVRLLELGWESKVPIPTAQQALGIDVDFGKAGHLAEVQFSNYPFFLNNIIRTNVLFNSKTPLQGMGAIKAAFIITKGKIIPASNSTLYFEQAVEQARFLSAGKTVTVPLRIVGLNSRKGSIEDSRLTHYHAARYSRTPLKTEIVRLQVGSPGGKTLEREPLIRLADDD